jgi:hypothetical protein
VSNVESARQSLQPLMLSYGFDSFTAEGRIAFVSRGGRVSATISRERLVAGSAGRTRTLTRSARAEAPGRVIVSYVAAEADYQAASAQALAPEATEPDASQSDLPVAMTGAQALAVAERWLSEGRVAQDAIEIALPPSSLGVTVGDVVQLDGAGGTSLVRIDRLEEATERSVTAVRVEPSIYRVPLRAIRPAGHAAPLTPSPVHVEFLDLPLLEGDETPHAPHVAVLKYPWAGPVAVYSSRTDSGYRLNREVLTPAVMGTILDDVEKATPGLWARGSIRVRLDWGTLQSRDPADVLNGANAAAVRSAGSADWEVIQFQSANRIGPDEYLLSGLLRGQAGTEAVVPGAWPAGADFVLVDAALVQLDLPAASRGMEMKLLVGPASKPFIDPSYIQTQAYFEGAGLRPYAPAHLRGRHLAGGGLELSWVRRTRIDGDGWSGPDVPLGEEVEIYRVTLRTDGTAVGSFDVTEQVAVVPSSILAGVPLAASLEVGVAQVSMTFGPGPEARLNLRR